jgi:membrane protein
MGGVFSDLRTVLGLDALKQVGRKVQDDDCFGLAGQLAYFVLLSLFPFLMFLVAMVGFLVEDPESSLKTLTESMRGLLPADAVGLLVDYIDRTLRSAGPGVLFFGIIATLWSGSAASSALIKASNRAYELHETRSFWKVTGISILMVILFAFLIGTLSLVILSSQTGDYLQRLIGLPDLFVNLWSIVRWVVAFAVVTLVHDVFYYMAPNADLPFKWVTPGGLTATALILLSSVALSFYVANLGRYDQLYGQLGAVIVLILWLYVGSFMVLVGVEINAVLVRMVEERGGAEIVQSERPADDNNYV